MARSDVDKRVGQALKALIAPRENSVRDLAQALDDVATTDTKIDALLAERDKLVLKASDALDAAKAAGWKPKELLDAGLRVPRGYTLPSAKKAPQPAPPAASSTD
jgi:hypothetical protein